VGIPHGSVQERKPKTKRGGESKEVVRAKQEGQRAAAARNRVGEARPETALTGAAHLFSTGHPTRNASDASARLRNPVDLALRSTNCNHCVKCYFTDACNIQLGRNQMLSRVSIGRCELLANEQDHESAAAYSEYPFPVGIIENPQPRGFAAVPAPRHASMTPMAFAAEPPTCPPWTLDSTTAWRVSAALWP